MWIAGLESNGEISGGIQIPCGGIRHLNALQRGRNITPGLAMGACNNWPGTATLGLDGAVFASAGHAGGSEYLTGRPSE